MFHTATFNQIFIQLQELGVLDSLFPFLLIFTIIFAFLQKTKLLGGESNRKSFNTMVAFILAAMTVIPHIVGTFPPDADPINIINTAVPNVSVLIIIIIMLWIVIGMLGGTMEITSTMGSIMALIAFVAVVFIFGNSAGWWSSDSLGGLAFLSNPDTVGLIVVVAVFLIIVRFITADDSKNTLGANQLGEGLKNLFKP